MRRLRTAVELGVSLALAALVLTLAGRLGGVPTLAAAMAATPDAELTAAAGTGPAAATVAAVLQAADCEGTVDFLRSFRDRSHGAANIVAWVVGDEADRSAIAARLEARVGAVPVQAVGWRLLRALRVTGHDTTPFVLVLDREGRVRYTAPGMEFFDHPDLTLAVLEPLLASLEAEANP